MQFGEQVGCHLVTRLDRYCRIGFDNQFVAKVFDHQQAGLAVGSKDCGCREALPAQRLSHRNERSHRFGQMRNCTVGLAVTHGRSIRAFRRVHQHIGRAVTRQPFVTPRRGIALDAPAFSSTKVGTIKEPPDRDDALSAPCEVAVAGDLDVARIWPQHWFQGQSNL